MKQREQTNKITHTGRRRRTRKGNHVTFLSLYIDTTTGVEFRQKIYLSDGQVDLENHLSVMKSTCPTQENHKIKRLFNVAP